MLEFPFSSGNLGSSRSCFPGISLESPGRRGVQAAGASLYAPEVSPCLRHVRLMKGSASESCLFPFRRSLIAIGMRWEERCWADGVGRIIGDQCFTSENKGKGRDTKFLRHLSSSFFILVHCSPPSPHTPSHFSLYITERQRKCNFGCCCGK